MNSKTLAFFSAMMIAFIMLAPLSAAQAQDALVNPGDPNYREPLPSSVMEAQVNARGIVCETGTCFKDSAPQLGYGGEPLIEPVGSAAKPGTPASSGKTKK